MDRHWWFTSIAVQVLFVQAVMVQGCEAKPEFIENYCQGLKSKQKNTVEGNNNIS